MRPLIPCLLLFVAACGDTIVIPDPRGSLPLVEALLIPGEPASVAAAILDSVDRVAVRASAVRLTLAGPGGSEDLRLAKDGRFEGTLAIDPGATYHLTGTIDGRTIAATTTVPATFAIASPAGNPILAAVPAIGQVASIPYQFEADGAAAFHADSVVFDTGRSDTGFSSGRMLVLARPPGAVGPDVRILALNRDAARYLIPSGAPVTNMAGGFGYLGAAVARTLRITWVAP